MCLDIAQVAVVVLVVVLAVGSSTSSVERVRFEQTDGRLEHVRIS